ncbi:phosphonate ABC transporter, permease protein PhnE [Baia soyae]|uniref:Phosphonate transport system permease protein n=1 Tax=Baia soyae TaxID=1544746 RepID=A0A4R2S2A4_9BACL|nr:phosphonate ABC transporter, permease protein PhnE [Baia soyae]TCP69391.1 phosphonate transport system permease protein [Baia soyae]
MKIVDVQKPKTPVKQRLIRWGSVSIFVLICIWAFASMPNIEIKDTAAETSRAIIDGILHPDWAYVYTGDGEDLTFLMIETLAIAFLGTFISIVFCIPFSIWAAKNIVRWKIFSGAGKVVLSLVRTIPELVMALLFVKVVGPGAFCGVLALGLHSIGMLGKLNSEEIEKIDMGPVEAMSAAGSNRMKSFWFAVVPQVVPQFLSLALYRFEINVRSATILGIAGAGGIGAPMIFAMHGRDWDRVGIILLGIIIMVTLIDFISGRIRRKLV